jgi:hypothetical protein
MGKKHQKKSSQSAHEFEGTSEEHIQYLQDKIASLQEAVDFKTHLVQRIRQRDIQLGKLSDKHDEQFEALEEDHEKQFDHLEERHEREIDKLSSRHEQEIEELESRQDREVDKLESRYKDIFPEDDHSGEEDEDTVVHSDN